MALKQLYFKVIQEELFCYI